MLFRHAGENGAKIFDTVKVDTINFDSDGSSDPQIPGRPVSANWRRKDGASGLITLEYLIDASGRQGVVSTKYLKNRKFNQSLKNIANWGYWTGGSNYGTGTHKEGSPFFEALTGRMKLYFGIRLGS
jgi:hypothetical protein